MIKNDSFHDITTHFDDIRIQLYLAYQQSTELPLIQNETSTNKSDFMMHSHQFWEIFFCIKGSIRIKTRQETIDQSADCITIVPPNTEHIKLSSSQDVEWQSICFSYSSLNNPNNSSFKHYKLINSLLSSQKIIRIKMTDNCLKRVHMLYSSISAKKLNIISLDFLSLLINLANSQTNSSDKSARESDVGRISQLETIITTKYTSNLKAKDVANQLFISVRQLDRIMTKRYGTSFRQTLTDRRLAVASNMLITTESSIESISCNVGFNSAESFRKAFWAKFGLTPSEYRQLHRL